MVRGVFDKMTHLEDQLGDGFYAFINPEGINYSRFDKAKLTERVFSGFWSPETRFGVLLENEDKRKTELLGVFRPFQRRAALTRPVELPVDALYDEGMALSPELFRHLATFFRELGEIEFPRREITICYEGEFKRVQVTRIMPERKWWKGMFIDVYVESDALIDKFSSLDEQSRKILEESDQWKRYEKAERYVRAQQEKWGRFFHDKELEEDEILNLLRWQAASIRPALFRNPEDYKYFLLGFHHVGFDTAKIHEETLKYFRDQRALERHIDTFNSSVTGLYALWSPDSETDPPHLRIPRQYQIFEKGVSEERLQEAYEQIIKDGDRMRSPIKISEDLWELGFLTLKRTRWRDKQPTKESYAFVRIKGMKPILQGSLPFKEFGEVELEREYNSLPKRPSPLGFFY
ncbi:hypothetical protein HYX14_02630 [Candidatus Woesearchaeota archaeon]|nr:hypothetical protein [Candidatus Woesearchaeota archaeon]